MSVSFGCKCPERQKPIKDRNWVVFQRYCNHSAFSGYHRTPSDYSSVGCNTCGTWGRTKAAYVAQLRDGEYIPPGIVTHRQTNTGAWPPGQ